MEMFTENDLTDCYGRCVFLRFSICLNEDSHVIFFTCLSTVLF